MRRTAALLVALACAACGGEPLEPHERIDVGFPTAVVFERVGPGGEATALSVPADHPADFEDGTRRAWRLDRIFGERAWRPGATLEIHADGGRVVRRETVAGAPDGLVAVLTTNRVGVPLIAWVDPGHPFPDFHGRGGSRRRPGDPNVRVRGIVRLRLRGAGGRTPVDEKDIRTAMLELTLQIDGTDRKLTEEELADLDVLSVSGDDGSGERDAFSLRDLVRHVAGERARAVGIRGQGHREYVITPEAWNDAGRTPILRLNRRGRFKFHWMDAKRAPVPGDELRNIHTVVVQTGG